MGQRTEESVFIGERDQKKQSYFSFMTSYLKTGVEPTPETSSGHILPQEIGVSLHNINIMNQLLPIFR